VSAPPAPRPAPAVSAAPARALAAAALAALAALLLACGTRSASTSAPETSVTSARTDAVCTSDTECPAASVCIDTHCLGARAWADGVLAARRARLAAARSRIIHGGEHLRALNARFLAEVAALFAKEGAAAFAPGHVWYDVPGAPRPLFKDRRLETLGDVDTTSGKPVPVPRAEDPLDFTTVLADLDALDKKYADAAVESGLLKSKLDDLDMRLDYHEHAAAGAENLPFLLTGYIKDAPAPGKPYPGCPAPPIRRSYATYVFDPATARIVLRVTVEADTPERVVFTPEKPCTAILFAAAGPPTLHVLSQHLRALQKGVALTDAPDTYLNLIF